MPIIGLTDRGLSFPEIGQIRKGGAKEANRPGRDLTYFRVEFDERERKAEEAFWAAYSEGGKREPTAIRIILPFNEIDRMWDAWLEAYTAGRMVARSNGETIMYQVDTATGEPVVLNGIDLKTGQPKPHPVNNIAGYDYQRKPVLFKASGRLKVIIPELARAAYMTVLTTSKHDIANISDQLRAFAELNKGQIAGIPFILRRRPKKISMPGKDGQRVRVTKWMLSIEADPEWVRAKLSQLNTLALPGDTPPPALLPETVDDVQDQDFEEGEYEEFEGEYPEEDEPEPAPEPTPLDLAKAEITSEGKQYGSLTTEELANRANGIADALKKNISPEKRADLERKANAIKLILASRQ